MQYQFEKAKVLVIGDAMLDEYWSGSTNRTSPEAPVAIVKMDKKNSNPGGACNTAVNISSLGGHVGLVAAIGDDKNGKILADLLDKARVQCFLQQSLGSQTICKLRVLSHQQQLIRADFEKNKPKVNSFQLRKTFEQLLPMYSTVIFSDYAKGLLSTEDIQYFIQIAQQQEKPVLVNPGVADLNVYRGAYLLSLNMRRLKAAVGDISDPEVLIHKAQQLLQQLNCQAIAITQGSQGMTLVQVDQPPLHVPTTQKDIYDVTGASDTVIATLALAVAADYPLSTAVRIANAAASIAVSKVGTASVSLKELNHALQLPHYLADSKKGCVDQQQLLKEVAYARQRGESIVMTNGCFDLLHAGHIAYLRRAKKMGDRLIVAINSDASIKRIKGPTRPIIDEDTRQQLLAEVSAVDWVVVFTEDTPNNLISAIKPDILVKGTDYVEKGIVGGELVTEYGGQIKAIKHTFNQVSTSEVIKRARAKKKMKVEN